MEVVNQIYNPASGVFGSGNVMVYAGKTALTGAQTVTTFTWTVPPGVDAVRARLWGGGGYNSGSGGGFAIKAIYGISGTTSVLISVGFGGNATTVNGGTSSFGSFVSATGGQQAGGGVGAGSGGDINTSGGVGGNGSGAGCGSIFGNGASRASGSIFPPMQSYGGAGAGQEGSRLGGGPGFIGAGATGNSNGTSPLTVTPLSPPGSGLENFSIDFIGTGGGGTSTMNGRNGGGGGPSIEAVISGGIPGGGGGNLSLGAPGLVIVEW